MSMMSVPRIPHAEFNTLITVLAEPASTAASFAAPALPFMIVVIPPNFIVFTVVFPLAVVSIFREIVFSSFPAIVIRVHPSFSIISLVHSFHPLIALPLDTALIMMSQNDRVSHTTTGTKQSPMNSLIENISLSDPTEPATN